MHDRDEANVVCAHESRDTDCPLPLVKDHACAADLAILSLLLQEATGVSHIPRSPQRLKRGETTSELKHIPSKQLKQLSVDQGREEKSRHYETSKNGDRHRGRWTKAEHLYDVHYTRCKIVKMVTLEWHIVVLSCFVFCHEHYIHDVCEKQGVT